MLFSGFLDLERVGDGQVISNNLHLLTNCRRDLGPVVPVILKSKRILNGSNGVPFNIL
jgi:hypothetical protein